MRVRLARRMVFMIEPESVIQVRVSIKSSRNEILGEENGVYKVKVCAPPVEGKANKALKTMLAKKLRLPKSSVEIVSGERSRLKTVRILGANADDIRSRLNPG